MNSASIVAWINVFGAAVAAVMQGCAARKGARRARWLHASISAVAVVYVACYLWLVALIPGSTQHWSEFMRGVGPVAWVVAWWAPAWLSLQRGRVDREAHRAVLDALERGGGA